MGLQKLLSGSIVPRHPLRENSTAATSTESIIEKVVGRIVFYEIRVVSKESRQIFLPVAENSEHNV
jgi:hypothetical protein